jgi:hypothetical protein
MKQEPMVVVSQAEKKGFAILWGEEVEAIRYVRS